MSAELSDSQLRVLGEAIGKGIAEAAGIQKRFDGSGPILSLLDELRGMSRTISGAAAEVSTTANLYAMRKHHETP